MSKKIILIFLLALAFLGYFYIDEYIPNTEKTFKPTALSPIPFSENEEIHFFSSGFAITDEKSSNFYDFSGNPIDAPLDKKDSIINVSTESYMIIDNKYLYDTSKTPFELILDVPQHKAWDIREYDDCLLIISKSGDNRLEPYIMQRSNNGLYKIDGLEELAFIDADYCPDVKGLSIITLNTENPFPSTQILHFTNINEPYGVLSIEDDMFYNIYRYNSFFIIIGLHDIQCYDIDGDLNWEIKIPHSYDNEFLNIKDGLALYFNNVYIENKNNTLIVTKEGTYEFTYLPRGLHHLKQYNRDYIGILGKKTIAFLNSKGTIYKKYELDTNIDDIYWTPHAPDNIYIKTDGNLEIYSTASQMEGNDDK